METILRLQLLYENNFSRRICWNFHVQLIQVENIVLCVNIIFLLFTLEMFTCIFLFSKLADRSDWGILQIFSTTFFKYIQFLHVRVFFVAFKLLGSKNVFVCLMFKSSFLESVIWFWCMKCKTVDFLFLIGIFFHSHFSLKILFVCDLHAPE